MNVLSPELLWIGNRCYRLPDVEPSNYGVSSEVPGKKNFVETLSDSEEKYYEYSNDDNDGDDDELYELEELIENLPDNRFKLSLSVPQTFWSKIIGSKGGTKKRIENDTKTVIFIPRPMEHGDIIIKGSCKRGIILAKKSINAIISSTRQKLVFTHFISVPMHAQEIQQNFIRFKDQVLKLYGKDRGVDESIFQDPKKLHLTIGTLVLTDQNERNLAEKLLNKIYQKSIKPLFSNNQNCLIEMKGIEYMNDDPAEVDVLYAKISITKEQELLQNIADIILRHFSQHKLIKSEYSEKVKLHVTLMNTLFREEEPEEFNEEMENLNRNKWNKKSRKTFNAVNILKKFSDFYFGLEELKTIQLSLRFSTGKDGYYKSSCILNL